MHKDLTPGIERALTNGYRFNFGEYISKGFQLAQQNFGFFIGFGAVYVGISFIGNLIPIIGNLTVFITVPLIAGMYLVADRMSKGETVDFNDFFKGFDKIKELIIMTLIMIGILVAIMLPAILYMGITFAGALATDLDMMEFSDFAASAGVATFGLLFLLLLIPAIYLGVSWQWAAHLIVFCDLSPWHALETSRKLISKNFFSVLGFAIVTSFIAGLGILGFFVGFLFTFPAMLAASYFAFADVIDLESYQNEGGHQDFLDHLVGE